MVPLEVLAGWRLQLQKPLMVADGGGIGDSGAGAEGVQLQEEGQWVSGICELFPRTTSITMKRGQGVEDVHVRTLANKCPGLEHINFDCLDSNLTDVALLALADKCSGLTYTNFRFCRELTDAAVLALAEKCLDLTHANFNFCSKLTDAGLLAFASKCPGLTHLDVSWCENLSVATKAAVREQLDS